jgi:hypothetical protein
VLHADDHKGWDWIVAADVAWVDDLIDPLVRTLVRTAKGPPHVSSTGARVLLAHQTRALRTDELLFGLLKEHFEIVPLSSNEYHPEFRPSGRNVLAVYQLILRPERLGSS